MSGKITRSLIDRLIIMWQQGGKARKCRACNDIQNARRTRVSASV
jgi:hypothetical protein